MKKSSRKLSLSRETVRTLRRHDLEKVNGGEIIQYTPGCFTKNNTCGDSVYMCTPGTCLHCTQ